MPRYFYDDKEVVRRIDNPHDDMSIWRTSYIDKPYYRRTMPYMETEPNQIVVDYIASMTDDYFIDLHRYLFPLSPLKLEYVGYFE